MSSTEQSINLPQILVLALIGFLALRWYLSSQTPNPNAAAPSNSRSRINPAHVEQIMQMFPQLDRRTVMWELQRSGGSIQTVTDKVLNGRALERPPQSFQPPMPVTQASAPRPVAGQSKPTHPDLITKYNLSARLAAEAAEAEAAAEDKGKKSAWSTNKEERQTMFQRRREEMILAARRKMEERDRAGGKS